MHAPAARPSTHEHRRLLDGVPLHYERHRPEQTTLYRLVQQHAASFIAHTEASTGSELPRFIKAEFNAFLECGILAHGFLRLRCGDCSHDKLLAFSGKRRGFCPSCGARRMSQTAAHLVDHVIPHVPVRQWVLSLPIPLRLLLAAQPGLVTPVLQVVQRVITRHLLNEAGLSADEGQGGAVTLIQRFGSAANLNIHLRCLVLDGVYRRSADGAPAFVEAGTPTDDGLHALLQTVIARLMKRLTHRGVLIEEMGQTYLAEPESDPVLGAEVLCGGKPDGALRRQQPPIGHAERQQPVRQKVHRLGGGLVVHRHLRRAAQRGAESQIPVLTEASGPDGQAHEMPQFSVAEIRHGIDELQPGGRAFERGEVAVDALDATDSGERIGALRNDPGIALPGEQVHHHPRLVGVDGQVHGTAHGRRVTGHQRGLADAKVDGCHYCSWR